MFDRRSTAALLSVVVLASAATFAGTAGRVHLAPAAPVAVRAVGAPDLPALLGPGAEAVSIAAVDLDRDGRVDLVVGYRTAAGGALGVIRGAAGGGFATADVYQATTVPELLQLGDVDGDGHLDAVLGTRGSASLFVMAGDGAGGFVAARHVPLDGALTALAVGEIDRADGLADVAAGVRGAQGDTVQVYSSWRGAFAVAPAIYAMPGRVTALQFGALDADWPLDLAVTAGSSVAVLRGRDAAGERSVLTLALGSEATTLALGRFGGTSPQLAVLTADGGLSLVDAGAALTVSQRIAAGAPDARLEAGKLSAGDGDDLVVTSAAGTRVWTGGATFGAASVTLELPARTLLAMPVALRGGLADLALLVGGQSAPSLAPNATANTFVVNSNGDTSDANPGDGVCADANSNCTLRAAIQEANASAGADSISFNLGAGTPTIVLASALPSITESLTIAGDVGGATRVEINGNSTTSPAFTLAAGSSGSKLRGLVINRISTSPGIRIESANNAVENCYVGTDNAGGSTVTGNGGGGILITGAAATGNTIGGSAATERNVISHNSNNGVKIDAGASANNVFGNYIGTTAAGNASNGNTVDGVLVTGASTNNVIGRETATAGTAPGNVISANSTNGVELNGSGTNGNVVAGNIIGLNADGLGTRGNSANGVLITTGAQGNTIGGSVDQKRNIISGNALSSSDGVEINGTNTNANVVAGNYIGLDINGSTSTSFGNGANGVYLTGGPQSNTIGGDTTIPGKAPGNVISASSIDGIQFASSSTQLNVVKGNLIGLNAAGTTAVKNFGNGVQLNAAAKNTIGGSAPENRNVISGHTCTTCGGVKLASSGANDNVIAGNYIGTDINGTVAIGNYNGIYVNAGSSGITNTTIGGNTATPGTAPGNVISGNQNDGVLITGSGAQSNTVAGNLVGTNAAGTAVLKNTSNGIELTSGTQLNTIGGTTSQARNIVSGNGSSFNGGISLNGTNTSKNNVYGNWIGLDITGNTALPNGGDGVVVKSNASANNIGGATATPGLPPGNVISGNTGNSNASGIQFGTGATNNVVAGNLVGTNAAGTAAVPNRRAGIWLNASSTGQVIGGSSAGTRNVISGNSYDANSRGIENYQTSNTSIKGNLVGLDVTGTAVLANAADGVLLTDGGGFTSSSGCVVGGTTATERNYISGNGTHGVRVSGAFSTAHTITGNVIGLDVNGTARPNGGNGVYLASGTASNIVGGTSGLTAGDCTGACNVIAGNTGTGVRIDGSGLKNAIRGNAIYRNGALGIDLGTAGVTPNDVLDPDTGANNLENFPVITSATYNGVNTTVNGTLNTNANQSGIAIDVFANDAADGSGYGQGKTYLGTATGITTDASGNAVWQIVVPGLWNTFSATTTDSTGNSSEFAQAFTAVYDSDGDGHGDNADCAPADPQTWASPAEVANQVFTDRDHMSWDSLATQAGPSITYDLVRGLAGQFPVGSGAGETCLGNVNGTSTTVSDGPLAGESFWYLVRGHNACGAGTYGSASNGSPRITTACP